MLGSVRSIMECDLSTAVECDLNTELDAELACGAEVEVAYGLRRPSHAGQRALLTQCAVAAPKMGHAGFWPIKGGGLIGVLLSSVFLLA